MSRVLALANQKGGVGKTTTAVNLAASLAEGPASILLVDLDPQGNATTGSGLDKHTLSLTVCDLLVEDGMQASEVIHAAPGGGFDILPANSDLVVAEMAMRARTDRAFLLKRALAPLGANYDWILIDCPPSLSTLTVNALTAADSVLIPVQCEFYALEGLLDLLETIEAVRGHSNPELKIGGLVRTMYDPRNTLARDVSRQLINRFRDQVCRTVIPRNVSLAEAPSHGVPVLAHDRHSRGAVAYQALAGELRRRQMESE